MSSRRSILSLAARLERTSICRRSPLHEASPAIRRRTSELPPLLHSVQPRRFTTTPIRRRDQAQDPHTTTDPTSVSKPAPSKQASSSSPPKIYTYEDILALTESPDANRILIGKSGPIPRQSFSLPLSPPTRCPRTLRTPQHRPYPEFPQHSPANAPRLCLPPRLRIRIRVWLPPPDQGARSHLLL